jgi:hypothetical protein
VRHGRVLYETFTKDLECVLDYDRIPRAISRTLSLSTTVLTHRPYMASHPRANKEKVGPKILYPFPSIIANGHIVFPNYLVKTRAIIVFMVVLFVLGGC